MEDVDILKLDNLGRGMTFSNGKPLYIEGALKDEKVKYEITRENSKYIEAVCTEVINKSSDRALIKCPYYSLCGGCNIMHMSYLSQLKFKKEKVAALLKKFAGINEDVIEDILPTVNEGYRNKVTLKVSQKVGFYKRRTYEIVDIDSCLVASNKINEIIKEIKKLRLRNISEVIIRTTYSEEVLVALITTGKIDIDYFKKNLKDKIDSLVLIKDEKETVLFGKGYITERLNDFYFKVSSLSFFQVNTNGAEKLYNKVLECADLNNVENVLDLYCGTGTIGIYLSSKAKKVIGVEINKYAKDNAVENAKINNVSNVEFICGDVGKLAKSFKNIDLVVIDPPRNGLNKNAVANVLKINPKKIVYVSCDPATLARDLNYLKEFYEVKKISMVDMFPNTYHCESITVLERR